MKARNALCYLIPNRFTLAAALALSFTSAHAALTALSFSGQAHNGTGGNTTRGYSFNVVGGSGVLVTALSVYDSFADGLAQSHDVGIWNAAGTLLASTTIPAGTAAPLDVNNLFRTVGITPLFLAPGANYVVGAVFLGGSADFQAFNWTTISTAPDIQYGSGRYNNNGVAALSFPTTGFGAIGGGLVGGSFELTAVPEPSTYIAGALLALPFGLQGFRYLRSRKQVS